MENLRGTSPVANRPVVYQPDSTLLHGLWSPQRTQEAHLLREYLATRPGVCFQCHDLPSLLPGVASVPPEIVVGRGNSGRAPSSPAMAPRQLGFAPTSHPSSAPSSPSDSIRQPHSLPAVPYVESQSSYRKAPGSLRRSPQPLPPPRTDREPARRSAEPQQLNVSRPPSEDGRQRSLSKLLDIYGRDEDRMWSGDNTGSSNYPPEGGEIGETGGAHGRIRFTPPGLLPPPGQPMPSGLATATRSGYPGLASAATGCSDASSGSSRSFPDFIRDTIAHFVHQTSPQAPDPECLGNAPNGREPSSPGMGTPARPPSSGLLSSSKVPTSPYSAEGSPDTFAEAAVRRPPVSRSLRDLLSGAKANDESVGHAFGDGSRSERKRSADQLSNVVCAGANESEEDGPLDLSKKRCPVLPTPEPPLAASVPAAPMSLLGSPVVLAKKNLHPVTSRVSDCLLRSVQKAVRITSALEGVDEHDRTALVCSSWHRLLLWLLAEENFSFVVVPIMPGQGRNSLAACQEQSQSGYVSSSCSSAFASGGNRTAVPTVGFVQAVTSFIDKCHSLKLDRIELDLLFSITLFHHDGQHSCSSTLADRLISQTRHRLMDELLRHTTASAVSEGLAEGNSSDFGGMERYSQLLLCLPALYAIDVRTFEVLFCERLIGPAVDMRLLLVDIIRRLL